MELSFPDDGRLLPPHVFEMTLDELERSMLVKGPAGSESCWNVGWREELVKNLRILVGQLWAVGITEIYVCGSFVENEPQPTDLDGYFVCAEEEWPSLFRKLNAMDPPGLWEKTILPYTDEVRKVMWDIFRIELLAYYGQPAQVQGAGAERTLADFFGHTREGQPKGIVRIVPQRTDSEASV